MNCPHCGYTTEKKHRSNRQNAYYWSCVLPRLSEHTGFTIEESHEVLKSQFLKGWKNVSTKKGFVELEYVRSTTDLNTSEFEIYMTKVREFCSIELNIWIPEPNETEMP